MSEVTSASCSWLKKSSYSSTGVDHICRMVPVAFHLASVRMRWVLAESDRTVMNRMKRRGDRSSS